MTHFSADDGTRIHLQISGEGSPVVMLHGCGQDANRATKQGVFDHCRYHSNSVTRYG